MSIDCSDFDRLMEQRHWGDLADESTTAWREHLNQCASCRAKAAADDAISHALATMPSIPCPARVVDAIMAATVHQKPLRARWSPRVPVRPVFGSRTAWAGVAVACVCVALVFISSIHRDDTVPFENDPGSVAAAGAVVKWSFVYAAQTLQTSQARVIHQTIAGDLPQTVFSAVSRIPILKGVIL